MLEKPEPPCEVPLPAGLTHSAMATPADRLSRAPATSLEQGPGMRHQGPSRGCRCENVCSLCSPFLADLGLLILSRVRSAGLS